SFGDDPGDEWRRVRLRTHGRNLLARLAAIMAEYAYGHTDKTASFAVPVDLRRHLPGLNSVGNFANMLMVQLERGETADDFRRKLAAMLDARSDAYFPASVNVLKAIPLGWMDRLLSRMLRDRPMETALISNLGRLDSGHYSCDEFRMRGLFALPMAGSVFSVLTTVDDTTELILGMPRRLASEGRFDAFLEFLHARLAAEAETSPG
ncbi:MAG: hypothetical protein JNL61_05915, partial [Rhizobiaceae bacterium]|nr:hypothetical protein [Rhizobiaceae bacterium]